ncbi:MAG: nuclear transport factor 2 family protein [Bacteroidetes bacterium]|nr:nuclear transport factor 2 family protein [Bacteroidota bacterium]
MKKFFFALVVTASVVACSTPETKTADATTQDQVAGSAKSDTLNQAEIATKLKGMEATWNLSSLDKDYGAKVINDILADDFYGTSPKGEMNDKKWILSNLDSNQTEVVNGPMSVHFYGSNFATVVGSHISKDKGKDGKTFTKHHAWTDTYMERNGKWQCIASAGNSSIEVIK